MNQTRSGVAVAERQRLAAILALDVEDFATFLAANRKATLNHMRTFLGIVREAVAENRGRLISAEKDTFLAEFSSPVAAVQAANLIHEEVADYNEEVKETQRMFFRAAVHIGGIAGEGRAVSGEAVTVAMTLRDFSEGGATTFAAGTYKQVVERVDLEWEDLGPKTVGGRETRVFRGVENIDAYASVRVRRGLARGFSRRSLAAIALVLILGVVGGILAMQRGPGGGEDTSAGVSPFASPLAGPRSSLRPDIPAAGENAGQSGSGRGMTGADAQADTAAGGGAFGVPMTLPAEPSIAVLPFADAMGDPAHAYLAYGLAEDVAAALSRSHGLRRAAFGVRRPPESPTAANALGVRYVLLGKTVKSGDRVRLSVQLMENGTPAPIFARAFDLGPEELAAAGRRIAQFAASAVGAALTGDEVAQLRRQETDSAAAFDLALQARHTLRQKTPPATEEAIRLFTAALEADRGYARAYAGLALAHMRDGLRGEGEAPAFEMAQRAVALDEALAPAYSVLSTIHLGRRDFDQALALARRAVALDPNYADGYATLGQILTWAGAPEDGMAQLELALRRNPTPPSWYLFGLGHARFSLHDYAGAIAAFRRGVDKNPDWLPNRYFLAASYAHAGDAARAEYELGQGAMRGVIPSVMAGERTPYRNPDDLDHFMAALHKAGVR